MRKKKKGTGGVYLYLLAGNLVALSGSLSYKADLPMEK